MRYTTLVRRCGAHATMEQYRENLEPILEMANLTHERLGEIIKEEVPDFVQPPVEEWRPRERLSKQALEFMIHAAFNETTMDTRYMNKVNRALLDFSGTPEAEATNQQVKELFTKGTKEEQRNYVMGYAKSLLEQDTEQLRTMSDEEVVRNAAKLKRDSNFVAAVKGFMADGELGLNDSDMAILERLSKKRSQFARPIARLEVISDPYYAVAPPEQLLSADMNKVSETYQYHQYFGVTDSRLTNDLFRGEYLKSVQNLQACDGERWKESMLEQIPEELRPDTRGMTFRNGETMEELDAANIAVAMQQGTPVICMTSAGSPRLFTAGENFEAVQQSPRVAADRFINGFAIDKDLSQEMVDRIEEDDHLWIRSSKEFREMKASMKALDKAIKSMKPNPSLDDIMNLKEMTEKVEKASKAYLKKKRVGEENEPDHSTLEQNRIGAAQCALEYVEKQTARLDLYLNLRNPQRLESSILNQTNQERMAENIDAERRFERVASSPATQFNRAPGHDNPGDLHQMAEHYYDGIQCPPSELGGEGLDRLKKHLQSPGEGVHRLAELAAQSALSPEQQKEAKSIMAEMTVFEMVLAGRGGKTENIQATELEQKIAVSWGGARKSLEDAPAFNRLVGNITPERLQDFIRQNGARNMTQKILDSMKPKAKAPAAQGQPVRSNPEQVRQSRGPVPK